MKVWTISLVLICLHGNSDSQTDVTMVTTEIMGTAPPTFQTLPPTPPPSIPPPPPSTSVEPTPTPEPPITTRIPPPPPPPSPPPPPPSSVLPPSPTPSIPTATSTPTTRILTTTVAIEPTQILETTRQQTEPIIIEPNPVAESLGKIGVLITGVALGQFDREQFKRVMAQEVNNYCAEYTGQCVGEGKTVSARDVVIVNAELYEQPETNSAKRRLLQEVPILVEYYVQDPILSTNVILTTEQQRVFLANEDVNNALENNIDGYDGIAPTYAEPIEEVGLEGWEIALIVIGSVVAAGLVIGTIAWRMSHNKANSKHIDVELQEKKSSTVTERTVNDYSTVVTNDVGKAKMKPSVDETDVSTQVKYKDILAETGFEQTQAEPKPTMEKEQNTPNGGTSLIVTAEITSSSSGSSTSSDHGDTELEATAEEQQEIPPNYEPPQPMEDSGNEEIQEEVTQVVNEFDKLIASQTDELTVNSTAFQNPGFSESNEPSTHSG